MALPFDISKLDMGALMGMARQMQERLREMEEKLDRIQVETVVGGGMVTVRANARGEVLEVKIDPELLAMDDRSMLENLVTSGVNQALAEARRRKEGEMKKLTGGILPPGFPGMFA